MLDGIQDAYEHETAYPLYEVAGVANGCDEQQLCGLIAITLAAVAKKPCSRA